MSSTSASPAKKKQRIANDMSKAIVQEILNQVHDLYDSGEETNHDLKQMETVSFEENRMDHQIMDTKMEEKRLSVQNDKNIRDKKKNKDEEEKRCNKKNDQSEETNKRKREYSLTYSQKVTKLRNGFKEIPDNLKKYFPDDHVVLQVKPDGTCGVACGAGHIFAQPSKSKLFRK